MEEELRCPLCRRFFTKPVLMPCSHSLCVACALSSQEPAQNLLPHGALLGGSASGGCNGGSDADSGTVLSDRASSSSSSSTNLLLDFPDIDKLSIVSETDSGVICNSRPSSYVGTSSVANIFLQSLQSCTYGIKCSVCERLVFLDENGALSLPTNRVLEAIVQKYQKQMAANGGTLSGRNKVEIKCERCLSSDKRAATSMCEQCEVFFCDICRSQCHDPAQDPSLAGHNLVDPAQGDVILRYKRKNSREHKCPEHTRETLTMFCVSCRLPVCGPCAQEGRHMTHDVQMLPAMCKSQKVSSVISTIL